MRFEPPLCGARQKVAADAKSKLDGIWIRDQEEEEINEMGETGAWLSLKEILQPESTGGAEFKK